MKRYPKTYIAFTLLLLGLCGLTGCSVKKEQGTQVVCTSFPAYDFTRNILAGAPDVDIIWLCDNGVDLHSYQPSVTDVVTIKEAEVLVLVGGSIDAWAYESAEEQTTVITMLDILGEQVLEEEIVEGMESDEEAESEEEEPEFDEHVWLSPRNAKSICEEIEAALVYEMPEEKTLIYENRLAYETELDALVEAYEALGDLYKDTPLIFADRFPFRYMAEEMQVRYFAAFPGCSSETSASFDTIIFLGNKMKEKGIDYLFLTEGGDVAMTNPIFSTAGIEDGKIYRLNSMQSVTKDEAKTKTYLSIMKENYETLTEAVN